MHEIKLNNKLEGSNKELNLDYSNDISTNQKKSWEQTQVLISKNIKDIFWKAWIKPLKFVKFEDGILYLTAESKIISNRKI